MSPEGATNALKEQIVSSTIADDDLETHRQGGGIREKVMASVGEMELIGLIALAAAELRRRKPFQDHPANQNFSEKVNEGLVSGRFRRVLDQRKREAQQDPKDQKKTKGNVWGSTVGNDDKSSQTQPDDGESAGPLDVDVIMGRFSPRFLQATVTAAAENAPIEEEAQGAGSTHGGMSRTGSFS
ncbi:unnamed protein product [Polarella glacialis]|uniref:Uncharacterized protein n=2 Tax=Polarella glacialis TaxID=89957 RepID=A0A813FS77_POLGL|nr:unnamed protein product [Polarella glacialis]